VPRRHRSPAARRSAAARTHAAPPRPQGEGSGRTHWANGQHGVESQAKRRYLRESEGF
jgi:hypothetical protein